MKKIVLHLNSKGLYSKFLLRLIETQENIKNNSKKETIPYSVLYERLCRNYSSPKSEIKETLFFLAELGFIEINCRGAKLLFEIKDG